MFTLPPFFFKQTALYCLVLWVSSLRADMILSQIIQSSKVVNVAIILYWIITMKNTWIRQIWVFIILKVCSCTNTISLNLQIAAVCCEVNMFAVKNYRTPYKHDLNLNVQSKLTHILFFIYFLYKNTTSQRPWCFT